MPSPRYVYLHGFASSPESRKARALAETFSGLGLELEVPDLNRPSFGALSHDAMLAAVDELVARRPAAPLFLVGSSLGGWVAARYAELHPELVEAVVLLAPGFHLAERWPKLVGEEWFAVWEKNGELPLPDASGTKVPVHWGFIAEARRQPPEPIPSCPTLVLHGRRDETVDIRNSREFVEHCPRAQLVELDDTHDLSRSIDRVCAEVLRHFGIGRPTWREDA